MRVLLIVSGFPTEDNPSRSAFNLVAANLLQRKHKVTILRIRAWKPGRKILVKEVFQNFPYIILSFPLIKLKFYESLSLSHFFLRVIIKNKIIKIPKFDIIHSVGGGLAAYTSYRISKEQKTPFIIQYIGDDVNLYLKKYIDRKDINNYINQSLFHVFNSKALLEEFSGLFKNIKGLETVYRGIDLKEYELNISSFTPIKILYLGGLIDGIDGEYIDNVKGGVDLLNAWKNLDSNYDLSNVKLYFGGPNSISASKYIDSSGLNFPESFEVIGEIQRQQVKEYLFNTHIVVVPSLFEGVPNVAYEAMATGNTIIGTEIGGIPEIINDKCGVLIDPENENEIANAIKLLISNKTLLNSLILRARKRIEKFDNIKFLNSYTSIYKEVKKSYNRSN